MIQLRTNADVETAASQTRAFVFFWVNWAIHAHHSQLLVEAVVESWWQTNPDLSAICYFADVSDQCGEVWDALTQWLVDNGLSASNLLYSGVGPLIWVHNGHVVAHESYPAGSDKMKLERISQEVWT